MLNKTCPINSIKNASNKKREILKYLNSKEALNVNVDASNFNELLKLIFCEDNADLRFCDIQAFLVSIEFKLYFDKVDEDVRKHIAWCKSRPKGYFGNRLKEYRKDASGELIKYNKYCPTKKFNSSTNNNSWVINIIIPKDKKEYFKLENCEERLLDKLFNYQSENVNTYSIYKESEIYNEYNTTSNNGIKKVVFVLENGYITNIIIYVDELKKLYGNYICANGSCNIM